MILEKSSSISSNFLEPNCDMPWEVYLDWLQDQGNEDLRFIEIHSLVTVDYHFGRIFSGQGYPIFSSYAGDVHSPINCTGNGSILDDCHGDGSRVLLFNEPENHFYYVYGIGDDDGIGNSGMGC